MGTCESGPEEVASILAVAEFSDDPRRKLRHYLGILHSNVAVERAMEIMLNGTVPSWSYDVRRILERYFSIHFPESERKEEHTQTQDQTHGQTQDKGVDIKDGKRWKSSSLNTTIWILYGLFIVDTRSITCCYV
jgi:hypothetical protein